MLLKDAASHMLLKNGSKQPPVLGNVYLVQTEPALGLTWKQVSSESKQQEMGWLKAPMIETLSQTLFQKVC